MYAILLLTMTTAPAAEPFGSVPAPIAHSQSQVAALGVNTRRSSVTLEVGNSSGVQSTFRYSSGLRGASVFDPTWTWPGNTTESLRYHLAAAHGIAADSIATSGLEELRAIHDSLHNSETVQQLCPNGVCPAPIVGASFAATSSFAYGLTYLAWGDRPRPIARVAEAVVGIFQRMAERRAQRRATRQGKLRLRLIVR